MKAPFLIAAALAVAGTLAGCDSPGPRATGPTTGSPTTAGMPQPPNSLPPGSAVNAPLTPATGNVTTRVGPSRP